MKVVVVEDFEALSEASFSIVKEAILGNASPCIGLTTGATQTGLYSLLASSIAAGDLDCSGALFFGLDEYVGKSEAVFTVRTFVRRRLWEVCGGVDRCGRWVLADGGGADLAAAVSAFQDQLDRHPRHLQVLGLGTNGHIGANEPGTPFTSRVHVAVHPETTIQSTMKFNGISREEAPTQMITQGHTDIMAAKRVLLVASGASKSDAVAALVEGPVTTECPSSILQNHPDCIVLLDKEAASKLKKKY
jgi:glucosamine-6-phosphate deaminase